MKKRLFLFVGVALACWQVNAQKSTIISSCEEAETELGTYWFTYTDGMSTISPKEGEEFRMTAGAGRDGKGAVKVSFNTLNGEWGCGLGFNLAPGNDDPKKPLDLSAGTGISFWYKGDGTAILQMGTSDMVDVINYIATVFIPASDTWQKVTVTWDKFFIPNWGTTKAPFNPAKATAIQWQIKENASGDFYIDDVAVEGVEISLSGGK